MSFDGLDWYEQLVLRRPRAVIAALGLLVVSGLWFGQYFRLDASADSLTLEQDEDLKYYRSVRARYGSDDYLIVALIPNSELFSATELERLGRLADELRELPGVAGVLTILDVPLVLSPPLRLRDLPEGIRRLSMADTDVELARAELVNSPLYRNYVLSPDGRTTAIRVDFVQDEAFLALRARRDQLREQGFAGALDAKQALALAVVEDEFELSAREQLELERQTIAAVRNVVEPYREYASVYLGGVPMIVADSIAFIGHDLIVFGVAVVVFLLLILGIAFRRPRWILLPLLNCLATCIVAVGVLGLLDWPVTVVSSNFLSLLLILTLALTLHIIVRYRETHLLNPDAEQVFLVRNTVRRIVVPCFYTALTTMVAFGSLIVSGIRPVIDFGWMMVIGISIAFVASFTLFPAGLMLLKPGQPRRRRDVTAAITAFFAAHVQRSPAATILAFAGLAGAGIAGIAQLTVENRFIDYYRESTDIYKGMELIDSELGGTTPLDVIIDAPREPGPALSASQEQESAEKADTDLDPDFDDFYGEDSGVDAGITATSYWFNSRRLPSVDAIHRYLDELPETGKVVSLATAARILQGVDATILEDNLELSVIFRKLPQDVKDALIAPYLSPDFNQLRFAIRIFESDPSLRRSQLLEEIRSGLAREFSIGSDQVRLSGMLVLYNNMLQSLFRSQVLTLGAVFAAILVMFLVLFRSLRVALVAIVPNIASAVLVLGLIGWLGIPLDLMTITIAAITVGIAVDDTIHYVHRYRKEYAVDENAWAAVARSHISIGRAMYYTSVTIMLGFSILGLSQFVPTVYFGLLTGFAMLVALTADMTLLPVLLVLCRVR